MALVIPRGAIEDRFRECRVFLSYIKNQESAETPPLDSAEVKIQRGLFYVQLYGALEQSLNDTAEAFLQAIAGLNLCNGDFVLGMLPTVMNGSFKSLSEVQGQKRWKKRVEFISAMADSVVSKIENTVFSPLLQSAEIEVISSVVTYMGISSDAIRVSQDRFYVDEVVQKRHQVAHGRASPSTVGARGRSDELEVRLDAVWRVVNLFVTIVEHHFNSLAFLTPHGKVKVNI